MKRKVYVAQKKESSQNNILLKDKLKQHKIYFKGDKYSI